MTMLNATWKSSAACIGKADLFFSDMQKTTVRKAKEVCGTCTVKNECLSHALKYEEYGVWGGMTANERRVHIRGLKKHGLVL